MELRTINTFLHIAELHSFSRAARELGYSQSAVSAQVAQLEAELETPLFDRVGKTVRLTDAGQTFLTYARSLLATAEQAKAALQPARQVSGTLRVALADSVCSTFLPDLLQRYHALCPQVELVLRTATDDEMLQMLGSNQIDMARWTSRCCSPASCWLWMNRNQSAWWPPLGTHWPGRQRSRFRNWPGRSFC